MAPAEVEGLLANVNEKIKTSAVRRFKSRYNFGTFEGGKEWLLCP